MTHEMVLPPRVHLGSLKVATRNIGDSIQILACNDLLAEMGLKPDLFLDRDTELGNEPPLAPNCERLLLPLNGWFKMQSGDDPQWPPHAKIIPVFSGFHMRPHVCPELLTQRSLDYLRLHEPIGCRDPFTMEMLRAKGVSAYFTNCLTLTFAPRPQRQSGDAVIVAAYDHEILNILPKELLRDHIFGDHYCDELSFEAYLDRARSLLTLYRSRARLVITTFLHAALPCIAMGIPVVVFFPNRRNDFMTNSDRERFSGLRSIVPIHAFEDVSSVDWNPDAIDVDEHQRYIRQDFREQVARRLRGHR